jgi:hypothetical protein
MSWRAILILLLLVSVSGCGSSSDRTVGWQTPSPAATASATPTAAPSPTPTPLPSLAWTFAPVELLAVAGEGTSTIAHLGPGFPVSPTGAVAYGQGDRWLEVAWWTPGRQGRAWVRETALTFQAPTEPAEAGIDALDEDLAAYLAGFGDRVGVEVYDVGRGTVYRSNADHRYTTASAIKVPIMLAFLTQLEAGGREPTTAERSLLTTMIENSRDASATALWDKIGGAAGLSAFMDKIGVEGLSPYKGGWSWSTMSPQAMVQLLARLHQGAILNAEHRALALDLMEHVQNSQRTGVGDTAPSGAIVAMKIGRWWYDAKRGGTVMSSSGIVTLGTQTYIISVFTDRNPSMPQAEATVRHICAAVAKVLLG